MSRFDRTWRQNLPLMFRLRMRFGLLWKRSTPDVSFDTLANIVTAIAIIVCLTAIYSLVDKVDRVADERVAKAQAHLLNGGILTNPEQTIAVKCAQVMDVVL